MLAEFTLKNKNGSADAVTQSYDVSDVSEKRMLIDAEPGSTYRILAIDTDDEEMNSFLFRLGCYEGEPITLVSKKRGGCIVVIKDGRYNLDRQLSEAIIV